MTNSRHSFFALLFRKHHRELLAFADRRAGPAAAEDLVQEAYARVLQHADPGAIGNPRAYLYRVIGNLAAREASLERREAGPAETLDAWEQLEAPEPAADAAAGASIQLARCVAALDELPKLQRHAFLLHRIDGLTHAEVAATLGISKRTVERYVAKTLAHCLTRLGQKNPPEGGGTGGQNSSY